MESWAVRLGLVLFIAGFGCVVGAMAFGVESHSRAIVWFRGALQRRTDYTSVGWRLYQTGALVGVIGVIVIVLALVGGPE